MVVASTPPEHGVTTLAGGRRLHLRRARQDDAPALFAAYAADPDAPHARCGATRCAVLAVVAGPLLEAQPSGSLRVPRPRGRPCRPMSARAKMASEVTNAAMMPTPTSE